MSSALMGRYVVTIALSTTALIVPVNIRATPPFIKFVCLVASVAGFGYSLSLAEPLGNQQWYEAQKNLQEREIMLHDLALGEMAAKEALELEYFPPAQLEEEAIALEQGQQNLKEAPQQKLLPDALSESLTVVIQLIKDAGGTITQRDLSRKTKLKANQVQDIFRELQSRGYGTLTSDGKTYSFQLTRQTR